VITLKVTNKTLLDEIYKYVAVELLVVEPEWSIILSIVVMCAPVTRVPSLLLYPVMTTELLLVVALMFHSGSGRHCPLVSTNVKHFNIIQHYINMIKTTSYNSILMVGCYSWSIPSTEHVTV